jgi:hypothetical protein
VKYSSRYLTSSLDALLISLYQSLQHHLQLQSHYHCTISKHYYPKLLNYRSTPYPHRPNHISYTHPRSLSHYRPHSSSNRPINTITTICETYKEHLTGCGCRLLAHRWTCRPHCPSSAMINTHEVVTVQGKYWYHT